MKKKKALLALLLCAALVLLTACQSGGADPSVPEPPLESAPSQSSGPREETPVALPETLPEDTTELTVPLQMVGPGTDGIFSPGEWSYSTQEDVDVCRQWLYDLKAEDITALYGIKQPLDRYWTGEMSMEDSRRVVELLRSMAPGLAPLGSGNPATGGGWDIALYAGDEAVDFGFDGYWFTFTHQGTIWIFDATDASVYESGYEIETLLWEYGYNGGNPTDGAPDSIEPPPPTETYFDDNVQAIYALDRENYVMAEVKDGYASSKAIWDELQNRVPSDGEPSGYGYLIITDEGKEYVYLTKEETALNKYCLAAMGNGPFHPSWLIHMTPERMVKFETGYNDPIITDRDELMKLAKFLKEEVTVGPNTTIDDGFNNSDAVATAFHWRITFDSGVEYTLIGYGGENYLSVYSSDLDKFVSYHLDEGVDWKFLEFEGRDWP